MKNKNTYFVINNLFFENPAIYELMWKNIVDLVREHMTIWRMYVAYWISKATNTHSEYVVLVTFHCNSGYTNAPQRHTYIACQIPSNIGKELRSCGLLRSGW